MAYNPYTNINEVRRSRPTIHEQRPAPRQSAPAQRYRPQAQDYLLEQVKKLDWEALADRTSPLPSNLSVAQLLTQFEQFLGVMYDDRWGLTPNR